MNTAATDPGFRPTARARAATAYSVPRAGWEFDLRLDANEGPPPEPGVIEAIRGATPEDLRRYPDASGLEAELAGTLGVRAQRVLVTNGADEAIDRVCKAALEPGRTLVTHDPTFSMIGASARLSGATAVSTPWLDGPFPTDRVLESIDEDTGLVALVTPNNPTGRTIPIDALRRVCETAGRHGALVMVDLAYVEFAETDPTPELLQLPNAVVVRTLSKAHGLAGLRVGYAAGPEPIVRTLRAVGGPYPVSSVSLVAAAAALRSRDARRPFIERIANERDALTALAASLGADPIPSQANSVAIQTGRAKLLRTGLASLGIAVRGWDEEDPLRDLVRITLPGDDADFERLSRAMRSVLSPRAILLDMDGVLADVSSSYRAAIIQTAASFGASVTNADIDRLKDEGDANNDWALTLRLLESRAVRTDLATVRERFQSLYTGPDGAGGLRESETLIPTRKTLERLASKATLGVVTGRPRVEARWFLERSGISDLFGCVVAMEDVPAKPDPAPTRLAMQQLGVDAAWLVGDTVDDVRSARAAGAMPVGVRAPGSNDTPKGPGLTIAGLEELLEALP